MYRNHLPIYWNVEMELGLLKYPSYLIQEYAAFNIKVYTNEPRHENRIFAQAKTKAQINCAVTAVFAAWMVQFGFFLNKKISSF